jgi:hypothetical protein
MFTSPPLGRYEPLASLVVKSVFSVFMKQFHRGATATTSSLVRSNVISRWHRYTRREVLRDGLAALGLLAMGPMASACGDGDDSQAGAGSSLNLGPLEGPDANGLLLPRGFRSRVVARSRQAPIAGQAFLWHAAPDGGAVFPAGDGGWIYVSNSEIPLLGGTSGGASALRFASDGTLRDAYSILSGTSLNCAGGPTPWGTWLSCEEHSAGTVWECDPQGRAAAVQRLALGTFQHEAVTVDPGRHQLYLTEDMADGRFYRFSPAKLTSDGFPDLSAGVLEVAEVVEGATGPVRWHVLDAPNPGPSDVPTRHQVPASTPFDGGEGIWFHDDIVYYTTKGDDRVWAYDARREMLAILYDADMWVEPILRGVDNIVVARTGDVIVAEDGDDMQIVAITPSGQVAPLLQVVGQAGSEITGPAFDPAGRRLYFSSQRGENNNSARGITYEVEGPFFV